MRIDKYLKLSRIIKRRTIAKQACESGKVLINDCVVSASANVKVGDEIKVRFGSRDLHVKVDLIEEHVTKDNAGNLYSVISDTNGSQSGNQKDNTAI